MEERVREKKEEIREGEREGKRKQEWILEKVTWIKKARKEKEEGTIEKKGEKK